MSSQHAVVSKLCTCAISLATYLSLYRLLPVDYSINDDFVKSTPFYLQVIYLYLAMLALRPKYYFVWTLGEQLLNFSEIIVILPVMRNFRCPVNPTAATFLLSAMWHGVYPGYYLTFVTGIGMTMAARAVRHNIRPYFLVTDSHKRIYDVITWVCTQVAISYTVVPFVLLAVGPSLKFYSSWYFSLHLLCLLVVLVLPVKSRRRQAREKQDSLTKDATQGEQRDHSCTDNNCNQKDKTT
ncbi:hypothetical protein GOODEAATRI_000475 [Goodea atripinnis]|uniref:Uncharacterized protein n=1 Tax=Goodea atripinnis TaxID=208336 RepID=A0ABV0MN84_9TELE